MKRIFNKLLLPLFFLLFSGFNLSSGSTMSHGGVSLFPSCSEEFTHIQGSEHIQRTLAYFHHSSLEITLIELSEECLKKHGKKSRSADYSNSSSSWFNAFQGHCGNSILPSLTESFPPLHLTLQVFRI